MFHKSVIKSSRVTIFPRLHSKYVKIIISFFDNSILFIAKLILYIFNGKPEVYGLENLPQENGYLITPNHQGLFDIVAVFKTHDKTAKFVLKKELASTILIKDVVKTLDYYALDRSNIRDGAKMVKNVSKEIEAGMNYVIYPEGTRSKQGNKIGEFKGGTFKIALKSHCPIVPVAMIDCYQVFDNNTIKPVKAQIHYLKPIEYDEYKDLKTPEIAALVQSRIQACMDEYC